MKKNPKPLRLFVHPELLETEEVKELARKGHEVVRAEITSPDLVIGPNCYRISTETVSLLELAVKSARAAKYPTKKKADAE